MYRFLEKKSVLRDVFEQKKRVTAAAGIERVVQSKEFPRPALLGYEPPHPVIQAIT